MPNPFYGVLPTNVSLGQNPTIQARYPNTYNCGNYNIISPQKSWKGYINNTNNSCFSTFQ